MSSDEYRYDRPVGVLFDVGEGRRVVGQLKLKNGGLVDSNVVSITDDQFFHIDTGGSLHGTSSAGRVSLLDCVRGALGTTGRGGFVIHHGDVSFRYAIFGDRHIASDEQCIRGVEFTLDSAEESVFRHDRVQKFGHLDDPDEEILDAIERKRPERLKGDLVRGKAMVSYFSGQWDFLPRFKTVLGTVHVGRSMRFSGSGGIAENTPRIAVDFDDDPTTLEGAWKKMREVRQFFAWIMGYAPHWRDVRVFTSRLDANGFRSDPDGEFEAFAPKEWNSTADLERLPASLIDASRHPSHFAAVMRTWLERNGDARRRSANTRFFGSIPGGNDRTIEDGIVSAANTFDLLPEDDKPDGQPLANDVAAILEDTRKRLKKVAVGAQREDLLNALGRIRANKRLRDVVRHRADIVLSYFGDDRLRLLDDVIRLAVECRNYYTHGFGGRTKGTVDYSNLAVVCFLEETLEFLYGVSELLICGWDPTKSAHFEWHPFGAYLGSFEANRSTILQLPSQHDH